MVDQPRPGVGEDCGPCEETLKKVTEMHEALIGTIDRPGLTEKIRVVDARSERNTKLFAATFTLVGAWVARSFFGISH